MEQIDKWPVIVKWHLQSPQGRISWYFRGISRNGDFYGEVQNTDLRNQLTINGVLNEQDLRDVINIVDAILLNAEAKHQQLIVGWKGLLASGIGKVLRVIMYCDESHRGNDTCGTKFIELINILRKYLPDDYR